MVLNEYLVEKRFGAESAWLMSGQAVRPSTQTIAWSASPARALTCGSIEGEFSTVSMTRGSLPFQGKPSVDGAPLDLERQLRGVRDGTAPHWSRWGGRFSVVCVDFLRAEVHLATDRFAVHPLCWSVANGHIGFSDRADAVPVGDESGIDRQALFNYLYFHVIPADRTIFRGVKRVEPATAISIAKGAIRAHRHWTPRFSYDIEASFDERAEEFRRSIRESVARHSRDSESVGCFLSGGTDSSTVLGMLSQLRETPIPAFSIGFDVDGYDEIEYARIAARHFGASHEILYVSPSSLLSAIPKVARHFDQPFGNSSAVPAYLCAEMARSRGIALMLAGDGGDELFGGNKRYAKQGLFDAWQRVPEPLRAVLEKPSSIGLLRSAPLARKLASYIDQARVHLPARMETYNLLQRFGAAAVLSPDLIESIDQEDPVRLQATEYERTTGAALINRMLAYDWCFTLADNDLPKVVGATSLAGLAVAFPLLDDSIVDFSLALAPMEKLHGMRLRPFFKDALRGFLPPETIAKKKHGFGLPFGAWAVSDSPLREFARESLASLAQRGVIRSGLVDELFGIRLEEHSAYYGEMVWILMILEQWFREAAPQFRIG